MQTLWLSEPRLYRQAWDSQKSGGKHGCDRYLSALLHLELPNRPDGDQKQSKVGNDVKNPRGTEDSFTTEAVTSRHKRIPNLLAWDALSDCKGGCNHIKNDHQAHGDDDGTVQDKISPTIGYKDP